MSKIPRTARRGTLAQSIRQFLEEHPDLHLGGEEDFHKERATHLKVFGIHNIPQQKQHSIQRVEFSAARGPHGAIPFRILYPSSAEDKRRNGQAAVLIYFHGGGYTIGSADEFENGLRLVAEESGCLVCIVDYKLAPEHRFPTQIDEYSFMIDYLMGSAGQERGIHPALVFGGGDSAGGNMTIATTLQRQDSEKTPLAGQLLLYPEARLPFDTPAAMENTHGLYLECNGIFSFADHYVPRDTSPGHRYISPGMQPVDKLKGQPPARVYTCGFDPLRDVGVEYARKLDEAGVDVIWRHHEDLTHGFLQMTAWSDDALRATKEVAHDLKSLAYK